MDERLNALREARELIKGTTANLIDMLDLQQLQYLLQVHAVQKEDLEDDLKEIEEIMFYIGLRLEELGD